MLGGALLPWHGAIVGAIVGAVSGSVRAYTGETLVDNLCDTFPMIDNLERRLRG